MIHHHNSGYDCDESSDLSLVMARPSTTPQWKIISVSDCLQSLTPDTVWVVQTEPLAKTPERNNLIINCNTDSTLKVNLSLYDLYTVLFFISDLI